MPRLQRDEPGDRSQKGRLARAVGTQQRDHLAFLDPDLHLQVQRS